MRAGHMGREVTLSNSLELVARDHEQPKIGAEQQHNDGAG